MAISEAMIRTERIIPARERGGEAKSPGIEKSQKRPVKVDRERDKIISQPAISENIDDMVSGPVGKAKDVDGEKEPDRVKMSDPEIKKGSVKHKGYLYGYQCGT